jgi:hypothetical protein
MLLFKQLFSIFQARCSIKMPFLNLPEHGQLSVGKLRRRDEHLAEAETDRRDPGTVRRTSGRNGKGKNKVALETIDIEFLNMYLRVALTSSSHPY